MATQTVKTQTQTRGTGKPADFLKARLIEVCDLAERSVRALREMDIDADGAVEATTGGKRQFKAEKFKEASRGLAEAGLFTQELAAGVEARQKLRAAVYALRMLRTEGDELGIMRSMRAEARRSIVEVPA